MHLKRDQADALLQESLATVRKRIQQHLTFLTELLHGDDWSFVIKTQALLEAAITEAILVRLGDKRIKKTVENMPLVGENASKLQFAKDLGLMDSAQRRFVKRMASLRNRFAHRVEYVSFKFSEYVSSLDRDGVKDWQNSIVWFPQEQTSRNQWCEMTLTQPRSAILMASFLIATLLTIDDNQASLLREIDSASEQTMNELLTYLHAGE